MNTKADLSMNTIVVAVLALLVLAIVALIFWNFMSEKGSQPSDIAGKLTCEGNSGICVPRGTCGGEVLNYFCKLNHVCCKG